MDSDSSECGRWSRLMKKRELLAYYILCREDGVKWNIGEAVDTLMDKLCVSRKVAFSIIRRLKRIGVLENIDKLVYRCIGFNKYFNELYRNYVCKKKRRMHGVC